MATLYELTEDFKRVYEMDDLDPETFVDTLEAIDCMSDDKLEGYVRVIRNIESENDPIDQEIQRLREKKQTNLNKITRLKQAMQENLEARGETKVKAGIFSVRIQNNPKSVEVLDERLIPACYFEAQKPKLMKKVLLDDIKAGSEIEGVEIKQTRGIRIQ